ncbi:MAG: phosphodiester glycosidase family protein [Acidobacteriota bacterium]|nr:phosphodiester glycosidase family protein [Acidobacteriota bacterium]
MKYLRRLAGVILVLLAIPVASIGASTRTSAPAPVCVGGTTSCTAWFRADTWSTTPSIYLTHFRPFPAQPSVIAYAAWVRAATTQVALYPGYKGPGDTALSRGPEMVPTSARGRLLATFNSGFYEADHAGGFYTNHTLYFPMVRGEATLVRYTNGTVDVVTWSGGARPGATVLMARQNLTLLVANSRPTPLAANNAAWGITLHGVPAVWRTAIGVDAAGNLIYAAAPAQTSASLAQIMVDLGCVRAMQLDINPEWPIFVTYGAPGAARPTLDVPNPNQIPGRFLYPSTKDFFAVYIASAPGAAQPW